MKLNTINLIKCGYREYQDINNDIKYYISSYQKDINKIKINIDVYRSIRGGLLYKIKYYNKDVEVYSLNKKKADIYDIQGLASIISRNINNHFYMF